ncbi:MAG: outer membrane beta-barrel protein [Pseudomonadota bacterium]
MTSLADPVRVRCAARRSRWLDGQPMLPIVFGCMLAGAPLSDAEAQVIRGPVDTFATSPVGRQTPSAQTGAVEADTRATSQRAADTDADAAANPPALRTSPEDFRRYDLDDLEAGQRADDGLDTSDTNQAGLGPDDPPPPVPRDPNADPYAPLGLRVGAFLLFPSLETRLEHSDNLGGRADDPESGLAYSLSPRADLQSDWDRHALSLRGGLTYETFESSREDDQLTFDLGGDLRLDLSALATVDLGASFTRETEERTDTDVDADQVSRTDEDVWSFTAGIRREFGRWFARLSGEFTRETFEDGVLADSTIVANSDRDRDEWEGTLRIGRALDAQWQVFGDVFVNSREFDTPVDADDGTLRGSDGFGVALGAALDRGGPISGELRLGYQEQHPDEPSFDPVRGLIADGVVTWRPNGLTTVSLTAETEFEETLAAGASGTRTYTFDLDIEHAFRRYLVGTASFGYELTDVEGLDGRDNEFFIGAELEYLVRRGVSVFADVGYTRFDAAAEGSSFDETTVGIGARVSR